MGQKIEIIKEYAKKILSKISINETVGESKIIKFLQDIENRNIKEDYNFLKITAERLRTQKIRIKDEVIMGQPIFEVEMSDNKSEEFITKEGAQNFIDANTTITKCSDIVISNEDNDLERRKRKNK